MLDMLGEIQGEGGDYSIKVQLGTYVSYGVHTGMGGEDTVVPAV